MLKRGGAFLAKVIQGGTESALLAALKRDFATVKHVKPAASRANSAELYVLATGFRGALALACVIRASTADRNFFRRLRVKPALETDRRPKCPSSCGCWACRWASLSFCGCCTSSERNVK